MEKFLEYLASILLLIAVITIIGILVYWCFLLHWSIGVIVLCVVVAILAYSYLEKNG